MVVLEMNYPCFLFVLDMMVLKLPDKGRQSYSLCRIVCFIGFTQYLLFIQRQSSQSGLLKTGYVTTDDALQIILVFLTDVPKPTDKRKC